MSTGVTLLSEATCPHCWEKFAPEDVLWVSEHRELIGDPKLGPDQQRRFLPSRFSPEGNALDEKGRSCSLLACPHCHLTVPRILLEVEPVFMSILGSSASGKSYFLAAMTWTLRSVLASRFAVNFTDVDAGCNALLNSFEGNLFLSDTPDDVVPLGDLIEKTQEAGDQYDLVDHGGQTVRYPRPFLFAVRTRPEHPASAGSPGLSRILCLYDNAGESFRPDRDRADAPVTRHMALSRVLFFVFDPTQDPRLQPHCKRAARAGKGAGGGLQRQETVLNEAAARVRRYAGLAAGAKHARPLVVILSKCDEWQHLLDLPAADEPSKPGADGVHALDFDSITARSEANKKLMLKYCPEIVSAAEDFCPDTTYVAVSSLGDAAEPHPTSGKMGIRPRKIQPAWVTVPMLHGLCKVDPKLIRRGRRQPPGPAAPRR